MTRPRSAAPGHEQRRAELHHPDTGQWLPATVLYAGKTMTVLSMDDGTVHHVYGDARDKTIRAMSSGQPGDKVTDGGQLGTLATCGTCHGHGTVFMPDPDQPAITAPVPVVAGLTTPDYALLEEIERVRDQHGLFLLHVAGSDQLTVYRWERETQRDWYETLSVFALSSLHALNAADYLHVVTRRLDDDNHLQDLPPGLVEAVRVARRRAGVDAPEDLTGLTVHRPRPFSDPYDQPTLTEMRKIMRAILVWLYQVEQPAGAMLSHHGASFTATKHRRITLLARVSDGHPSVHIEAKQAVRVGTYGVRNPLGPDELDQWKQVAAEFGFTPHTSWNGHPTAGGSFCLHEPPHPSLLAALELHAQGCTNPEHIDSGKGGALCPCGWWRPGAVLLKNPDIAYSSQARAGFAKAELTKRAQTAPEQS